ncbi:MAG: ParB/RepB/Spo0J family partition protein [Pseudomonadota bacterium]
MAGEKKRGLGRGLSALMADVEQSNTAPVATSAPPVTADMNVPIEQVHPNPDQPRRTFVKEDLEDLAASISEKGIIQPLIVRNHPDRDGDYEIVAGERRWRAAQMAKLHDVPIIVRQFSDTEVLEVAIIENIQRADLNPVEEALGFQQLIEKFDRTQEQMAAALGKSRPYITNTLRLLSLPDDVQALLAEAKISAGHARALITSENASALAAQVVAKGLSVRETEKLTKKGPASPAAPRPAAAKDADTKALEGDLSATLGMPVTLSHAPGGEGGALTIKYGNLDQLDDLCRLLAG